MRALTHTLTLTGVNGTFELTCAESNTGAVIGGVIISLLMGMCLALSMNLQRWTLKHAPGGRVQTPCGEISRALCWSLSVSLYGVSNGVYQSSLAMAPLTLCTSFFTLVLVWNVIIARKLVGEVPNRGRLVGVTIIIIGVVVSVTGVPQQVCNEFQLPHVKNFTRQPSGLATLITLLGLMLTLSVVYMCFERSYSIRNPPPLQVLPSEKQSKAAKQKAAKPKPPAALDGAMAVVAPISLGLQEAVGGIVAKNLFSIFFYQAFHEFGVAASDPVTWAWCAGCATTVASLTFLKMIYARYETTEALPIEYGTVHACSVLAGFVFFRERDYMTAQMTMMTFIGLAIVILGVGLSSCRTLPCERRFKAKKARRIRPAPPTP